MGKQCAWIWERPNAYLLASVPQRSANITCVRNAFSSSPNAVSFTLTTYSMALLVGSAVPTKPLVNEICAVATFGLFAIQVVAVASSGKAKVNASTSCPTPFA